ncbi:MAG: ABC transporter permease [Roseburia sp.]|nr:ABC transporter permease [Roseburia sp.]MCM1098913.1 ABC transporter permease [Ruminococcus flavefaciens]
MYAKLFRSNLRKALRDYMLYFFTLVVSSTLFFAFLSLTSRYNDILGGDGNYSLTLFQDTIRYAVLAVSVIFVALVRYINNYMLRQRSREFAIYRILGMEPRIVAMQFFRETFAFGTAAVFAGCLFGTLLSGILTAFVMRSITPAAVFRLGFYPDTILITLLFFCAAFLLVGAWNSRRLYRIRLIDLLNEKKAGEGQTANKKRYAVSLAATVAAFSLVGTVLYGFAHKNGVYAGNIPEEISNRYQAIAIIAAVVGIFSLYNAVAFLLTLLRRRKRWKNRRVNSVLLGSLFQKVSSTAKVLSVSTLAITIALVAFVLLPMLAEITTGYLDYRMPYDVMIYNTYRYIDRMEDIPEIDFSFIRDILREHDITVSEEVSQRSYFIWESDFNTVDTRESWRDLPRLAMRLSDYNKMREMAGIDPVSLAGDSFFMHLSYETDLESVAAAIGSGGRALRLDDGTVLTLAEPKLYNDPLGTYLFHQDDSVLVFPDSVCDSLRLARTCYYANTESPIPYGLCDTVREEIAVSFRNRYSDLFDRYETKYQSDPHYISFIDPIRFRTQESNDVALTATSVRLLGIYSGVIFFVICMTVLALHLTTDSIDQSPQYRTLYQLGTDRDDIVRMVSRQSLFYFFTPCLAAFLIALPLIYSFALRYGHKIFAYMSSAGFRFGVLIPGLLILVILACYYGAAIYIIQKNLANTLDRTAPR